ncbi:CYFA0S11e02916g1_1 [Cyberlindnera fabianii]|uniref:CYFA0S11e02916g1_1 n=1 Tax=Cyberlindnera fabianii TaxID=36022 RepID=A0A061B030_CYBFA|nr:CYFA0S11e02916g1_1 [Cyberlindnera fabianii]
MALTQESLWAALPNTARAQTTHLSYDAKNDRIAYAAGKSIFIRDVEAPSKSIQYTSHTFPTTVASFSPSGFYMASGDESGNVKIWDTMGEDLVLKGEYQIINGRINAIVWDADSNRVIAVGNGKERYGHAFTWDSGNTVGEISGHSAQINAAAIRPVRPYRAATVSDDSALVFYHGPPFRFEASVRGHHTNFVRDVKYSPDGAFLVSVGADRQIVVYDGKTGEFLKKIGDGVHEGGIFSVSWVDSERFVTSSADATVKLWNVNSGEVLKSWGFEKKLENHQVGVVATKKYVISLSFNGDLNYWTEDSEEPVKVLKGHQKSITACLVTKNGELYTGSYDGRVAKWDTTTGNATYEAGHSNLVVGIVEDSKTVYSAAWDDKLQTLDASTSTDISGQPKSISSSGEIVAVITEDTLFGYKSGSESFTTKLPTPATAVGASSSYIAVGFQNNSVSVFSTATGAKEFDLPAGRAAASYIAFSPNGAYLAVGDASGKIILYDVEAKSVQTSRWAFHTGRINSIAWNEDNNQVVSGSLDTNIIVYRVDKPMKNVKFMNAHKDGVNTVQWLKDDVIVSGGSDAAVKTWKVTY